MTQEQFQKLFDKHNDAGANFSLLAQLKFLFEFSAPDEMYELIVQSEEFEIREWMRFALMDGVPMEQIREYPQMNVEQIRESRRLYFYKKEGVQELKETEEIVNRKLQKLEFLVEKTEPMEKFLNVLLKQKDELIANFQQQITRMQEQNAYLTEQLKEYSGQIEELKREGQQTDNAAEIAEYQEIREENPVVLPTVRRGLWRRKYWKKEEDAVTEYLKLPFWSSEQLAFLVKCLEEGMELDEIKMISGQEIPVDRMRILKRVLEIRKERAR